MYSNKDFVGYFKLKRFCILIISKVIEADTVIKKTNEIDTMIHVVVKKKKMVKCYLSEKEYEFGLDEENNNTE